MKRILTTLAVIAGLTLAAAPARAEIGELPRLSARVMCVHPDFPVLGSGWKVHTAIAKWNEVQTVIRLTTVPEPGCAEVLIHRYSADDGQCGYTSWSRIPLILRADGQKLAPGADIYLNDACAGSGRLYTRRVVAHELGHAMGLPHYESCRSVMAETWWYPLNKWPLIGLIDVRHLSEVYAT